MWTFFIDNLDLKLGILLDIASVVGAYIAVMGIIFQIEKSKRKIRFRSAILSIVVITILTGVVSFLASTGRNKAIQSESEQTYTLANAYFDSGSYREAILEYEKIPEDSSLYVMAMQQKQAALNSYLESCFAKSSDYVENGSYVLAIDLLKGVQNDPILVLEPTVTASVQAEIVSISDKYAQTSSDLAFQYWSEGNIVEALKVLQDASSICTDSVIIKNSISSIESEYRNNILNSAAAAFSSEGYQSAINVLSDGLSVLSEDEILLETIDQYKLKRPVPLSSLDYYMSGGEGRFYFRDTTTDNFGSSHSDIIFTLAGFSSSTSYASQTYRIDKKYARITGTVFLSYEGRDTRYSGSIKIYGDGDLILSVTDISPGFEPETFDLDITNIVDLEVYIDDPGFYGASGDRCLSNVLLYPL